MNKYLLRCAVQSVSQPIFRQLFRRPLPLILLAAALLVAQPKGVMATEVPQTFRIDRFQVEGNSLLPADTVTAAVTPFQGDSRNLNHLYAAAEALQLAYMQAGYPAVQVALPEQKLEGVVRLKVIEGRFKEIEVKGNKAYSREHVRESLPSLVEGTSPNMRKLDMEIRQANENPGRRLAVNLQPGGGMGELKARIDVSDEKPQRFMTSLDNTGTKQTGIWRLGLGYLNADTNGRGHVFNFQYVTAPERLREVQVASAGYRIPLPALASNLEMMAAYSNVKAGVTQTVAGPLFFAGKGNVFGVKMTRRLESQPEWEHKLSLGLDYKDFRNDCAVGTFGSAGCGEAGASIAVHPITAGYAGSLVRPTLQAQWNVSLSHNLPGGTRGGAADFTAARAESTPHFNVLRANGSMQWPLSNWMLRLGAQLQETDDALVQAEQFGLGGAQSVRGYDERAASNDRGYATNLELYTPELAQRLNLNGSVRALFFIDSGTLSRNRTLASETGETVVTRLRSAGIGLRASLGKYWSLSTDVGYVIDATSSRENASLRTHFNLSGTF